MGQDRWDGEISLTFLQQFCTTNFTRLVPLEDPHTSSYIIIHHHTSSYIHTILIIHTIHIHIHIHMSYCHPYNPYPYKSPVSTSPAHPVLGTCSAQNLARRLNQLAAVRASARLCFFSAGILPQVKPVDGEG